MTGCITNKMIVNNYAFIKIAYKKSVAMTTLTQCITSKMTVND